MEAAYQTVWAHAQNATVSFLPNTNYFGVLDMIKASQPQLSYAEQLWSAWYAWWQNDVIATGVMSFLLHEIVYFGRCLPWMIVDRIPYFHRWKLQDAKVPSAAEQWQCTRLVLLSHFTVELPQIWLFHPMCEYFGLQVGVPFPGALKMAYQIALFFVMEDTFHYWAHRALHWGPLYKHIHKIHHQFSAPFGLAAEYAHPAEVMILGMGTVGSPILYCALTKDLHIVTVYAWIVLRLFQAVDAHSGYDFPWGLRTFVPFWSGADHHDYHHQAFVNCYSTSFRWWDHFLGTDKKYKAYRAKQAAEKQAQTALKAQKKGQ
ncbi:C-4 sterol methyl oxidase [Saitoella coloradoensis]